VFLSADRQYVEQLARDGKVAGSRRVYARGRLVMWSRDIKVSGVKDIISSRISRVALANPDHAPYGRAARQALEHVGLWATLQDKFVLADTIRHSLEMAESGNADLAFTALSLLTPGQGFSYIVPDELYDPLDQEAAVVQAGADAERFLEYLGSDHAKKILAQFGFLLPK
jgi:molybdate transport system substrate-binding protein